MPGPVTTVTVRSGAPTRLRKAGEAGCFVLVKPTDQRAPYAEDLVVRVREAVEEANAAVAAGTTIGAFTTATKRGIAIATFRNGSVQDTGSAWLAALAGGLESRGLPCTVGHTGSWSAKLDPLIYANFGRRFPTAFVAYTIDSYPPRDQPLRGWQVDPSTIRAVSEHLETWSSSTSEEIWAGLTYGNIPIPSSEVAAFFESTSAISNYFKILNCVSADRTTCRRAALIQFGQFVSQVVDPNADWRTLLDAQIDLITKNPQAIDVGLIKNIGGIALSWQDLDVRGKDPHRTVRLPGDYDCNRHLWDEYVIDAAGVQLLTRKHLDHAADLSDWHIDEVAPDRYLVTAKKVDLWYADIAPDSETVSRARHDFGDMILSWDAILASPGPYSVTDSPIVGR